MAEFGAWEKGEVLMGAGEMMGRGSEELAGGHKMVCVHRQLGLQGVAGPAWVRGRTYRDEMRDEEERWMR